MKSKALIAEWLIIVLCILIPVGCLVYYIDPFFHYHAPYTDRFSYEIDNQRFQNDGIAKHFDYNAVITGTSLTRRFRVSVMDHIFNVKSVKMPFNGASYKEVNDNLSVALSSNPRISIIIRCLDTHNFFQSSDEMFGEKSEYPTYLYDTNPINDVNYLFNHDVVWHRIYPMLSATYDEDFVPGITAPDAYYALIATDAVYGIHSVRPDGMPNITPGQPIHLSNEEMEIIRDNIEKNVTSLADQYPSVAFYYYFSPCNLSWWANKVEDGTVYKTIEAEEYITKLILGHDNIKLYSFNDRTDITADLNNYTDGYHYGVWISDLILKWIHDGEGLLTTDNYKSRIADELTIITSYNYDLLKDQEDYTQDLYAGALLDEELTGLKPVAYTTSTDNSSLVRIPYIGDYRYAIIYTKGVDDSHPMIIHSTQGDLTCDATKSTESSDNDEFQMHVEDLYYMSGALSIEVPSGASIEKVVLY